MTDLTKLTIVVPADREAPLIEALLELELPAGGFTTLRVEGHGETFESASDAERVKGRTQRLMVMIITSPETVDSLISRLKTTFHLLHAVWWTEPVIDFGKLQ